MVSKKLKKMCACPRTTRGTSILQPFDHLQEFERDKLPSIKEVIGHFKYIQKLENTHSNLTVAEISGQKMQKVLVLWRKADLPTVSESRIVKLITDYHRQYRNLLKHYTERIHDPRYMKNYRDKFATFGDMASGLFDISKCKCQSIEECGHGLGIRPFTFLQDLRKNMLRKISELPERRFESGHGDGRMADGEPLEENIMQDSNQKSHHQMDVDSVNNADDTDSSVES